MAVSNRPWSSITESDYKTPEAFCSACLIDLNTGREKSKSLCKLPVREPGGALNRSAVHAAAAALAGARGGVKAPADAKKRAARRLLSLYRQLKDEPPPGLKRMAS